MKMTMMIRTSVALMLLCAPAWGQNIAPGPGVPASGPASMTGPLTISPPYAGLGLTIPAINFAAPSPLSGTTAIGYGTGATTNTLQIVADGPGSSDANTLGLTNTSLTGIASLTLRGRDNSYTDTTTIFEHGAMFWLPGGGTGSTTNQGVFGIEASRFDGASNPLIPPPYFHLDQTGGVDPTGGANITCTTANTSAVLTSCGANSATTGQLVTGVGIPPATTVVSGGGTATITMSAAATASNTETVNFSTPVYAPYTWLNAIPGGNVNIRAWDATNFASFDRVNSRVGIGNTAPAATLDVVGTMKMTGVLTFAGTPGLVSPSNVLHIGDVDSATPAAQLIQAQSVVAGTSNTAGANFTLRAGSGTGTGAGGTMLLQTYPAGGSGTSQNTPTTRVGILPGGQVIVGSSTTRNVENGTGTPLFQVQSVSNNATNNAIALQGYGASATAPANLYLQQSNSNTLGTQTAVASGTSLGQVTMSGSDGTNFQNSSRIIGQVDGTVGAGQVPGRIVFQTATAAGTLTEAMRLDKAQGVTFPGVTTGTNADFVCMAAGNVLTLQTSACTISSLRFKDVIGELLVDRMVADVMALHPIAFKMKTPAEPNADPNYERPQIGLTAENVAAVDPRLAIYDDDMTTPKSYRQEGVIAALVVTAQAQQREIRALIVATLVLAMWCLGLTVVVVGRRTR